MRQEICGKVVDYVTATLSLSKNAIVKELFQETCAKPRYAKFICFSTVTTIHFGTARP